MKTGIVLAKCGHWWRESRPDDLALDEDAPRVCSVCRPDNPNAVAASPQGFAMVPVVYIEDWGLTWPW